MRWKRPVFVVGVFLLAVLAPAKIGDLHSNVEPEPSPLRATLGPARATQGGDAPISQSTPGAVERGKLPQPAVLSNPRELQLTKAGGAVFDVRALHGTVVKQERPERAAPGEVEQPGKADADAGAALPSTVNPNSIAASNAPAPAPLTTFEGLDFANWGAGHPPDTNGDVGPTYYIETINTAIGIYDKSTGTRVAAFTFNAFMSQGSFGNLCDTDNFGDPVVVYDSFEDRWVITDFAFALDASRNVSPQTVFECFAVSKTGDPVNGGWNFYSILAPGGLSDYPKFGVWPDGIYMSANMFGYAAGSAFQGPHVWAINKQQMYAGEPSVQVLDFPAPSDDFTVLPANARLQAGVPPVGTPEYFVSTEEFLNALTVYKLQVDWAKISTSTFAGPETPVNATSWPNASVPNAATPGNSLDTLQIRAMAQAQYSNLAGAESLWVAHTVRRANTTGFAAPRWYQLDVTGGTVAANTVQGTTWDPDAANVLYRFTPSLAVDRAGDMALGYSSSNSTKNPGIKYAGRLAGDPMNTFSQTEQTLIDGTGTQSGNCGAVTCVRWGDYSGMALDPDGCRFWMANEYYQANGLDDHTRIGSFQFPGCTTVGNGTLSGTVTDGAAPLSDATIQLGSRTTTTDGSGQYSFSVPAGTYSSLTASKPGYTPASAATIAVPDGGTATRNFTLAAAPTSGCFTDNTQSAFQAGVPSDCDLTATPGSVQLSDQTPIDQKNETLGNSGVGITTTTWGGQTFTPSVSGPLTRVDANFFCSGCTGTTPDLTLSIRATSGGLPTGADLASGTIAGFSNGAAHFETTTLTTPLAVTAGTMYAIVVRPTANPSPGTYALTRSGSSTAGADVYAAGTRVAGATSGTVWSIPLTGGVSTDAGFRVYLHTGFPSVGTFVSSVKDADPRAGRTPTWTTLSFTATTPAGTDVKFQVAASDSSFGTTNFVGPDGTANTFFTTNGASLSRFDGFRYLRYKAFLTTTSGSATPSLSSVSVCFVDTGPTTLSVAAASGTFGGTADLSATLTAGGTAVAGESIHFTLNGNDVGTATTDANGTATTSGVSLVGIDAGSYPSATGASFAGDNALALAGSSSSGSLTVAKANQAISVTTHAPASAVLATSFTVAATGGSSGNPVTFSSAGACTNVGATFTMTSGTGTCTVQFDQAGDPNHSAAPQVSETVQAQNAIQAISVTTHAPAGAVFATSFTVAATGGGSGNPVTFSSAGVCTNVGATFTMTSGTGTCTVQFDQAGDANHSAAPQVSETVQAQTATQAIAVTTPAPPTAAFGSSFAVAATAPGGAVTFSASGACANSGGTFTMTSGAGTCTVQFDQAGDANHSAAPQVSETVQAQTATQAIAVTTHAPAVAVFGTSFEVAAFVPGDVVTFSSSGACSNSGSTFTMTSGSGTCTVMYDPLDDASNHVTQVTESVEARKAAQTITLGTLSSRTYGDAAFALGATASSGLGVDYSVSGPCTLVSVTVQLTGAGLCTVRASQEGDSNHEAASPVTQQFSIAAKAVTITPNDRIKLARRALSLGTTAFTVSGLVNGDGIAGVTLTSTGAGARATAGTYPILASAALGAATTNLANYTIAYGKGSITVVALPGVIGLQSVSIRGNRAVIDSIAPRRVTLASNGSITLKGAEVRGNVLSTHGSVTLTKASRVTRNVRAGTRIRNAGNIGGIARAHSPSPTITAAPIAACSPFSGRTGLSGGFTYDPATGDLRVDRGATLTLAPGTYCFHALTIARRAVLNVTGPVTIAVTGRLRAAGKLLNTTASPPNLLIVSSYTGANGVALAVGRSAYLTAYAPSTRIALTGGGTLFGGLLGQTLAVSGNSDVRFDLPT
jgi:hypothetical protein